MHKLFLILTLTAGVAIGHGGPDGDGGQFPAWLQGAQSIIWNQTLTRAEQQTQLTAWALSQNSTIQAEYQAWLNQEAAMKANFTAQHQAAVATLPAAAQAADAQIQAIMANDSLTWRQTDEAVRAVFDGLNDTTKQELQSITPFHAMPGGGGDSQEQMGGGHRHKRGGDKFGGGWNGQGNHTRPTGSPKFGGGWNGQWNHTRPTGSPKFMNFVIPNKNSRAPKQ